MIKYKREMDLRGQLYVALAISALCWLAVPSFAGVIMGISGKIVSFDAQSVTLQLDGSQAYVTIPRSSLSSTTKIRPGERAVATLNNQSFRKTSITSGHAGRELNSPARKTHGVLSKN